MTENHPPGMTGGWFCVSVRSDGLEPPTYWV